MDILRYLGEYFWVILIFFFVFGGSVWGAAKWILQRVFQHRERMQEIRNEQLRLQLQLEQTKLERVQIYRPATGPKETSWDELAQATYDAGYQEQKQ